MENWPWTDNDKVPLWEGWQDRRPGLTRVLNHATRGGLLGLIYWSVGMSLLDQDGGDPWTLINYHPSAFTFPSLTPGHHHLAYYDTKPRFKRNWSMHGASGQIIGATQQAVLWPGEEVALADALARRVHGDITPIGMYPERAIRRARDRHGGDIGGAPRRKDAASSSHPPPAPPGGVYKANGRHSLADLDHLRTVQPGGRNDALYRHLSEGGAALPRGPGSGVNEKDWYDFFEDQGQVADACFPFPLSEDKTPDEVRRTSRSAARRLWNNPTYKGRGNFRVQQQIAQLCQANRRREGNNGRNRKVITLAKEGWTAWAMARECPELGSRGRIRAVLDRWKAGLFDYLEEGYEMPTREQWQARIDRILQADQDQALTPELVAAAQTTASAITETGPPQAQGGDRRETSEAQDSQDYPPPANRLESPLSAPVLALKHPEPPKIRAPGSIPSLVECPECWHIQMDGPPTCDRCGYRYAQD